GTFAQIDAGGKAAGKFTKSATDIGAACTGTEEGLSVLFPGLDGSCHASAGALATCINTAAKCRACLALNDADGQDIDCDILDDNTANGSCGGYPAVNIGTHACTLNAASSSIALTTEAFPIPPFSATGALSIACGTTAPDGTAACDCTVTNLDPVVIPAIGDVCVNPAAGCPSGQIDCDGGAKQDVNLVSDHTIGACASNAACDTACDATCAAIAPAGSHVQLLSGCEGRCQGGAMDEAACTSDTQCTGGQCVGAEPVNGAHVGLCNCTCGGTGLGAPSLPGSLSCSVGTQIDVELPSDNDCLDPNTIVLPPLCGPVTTTTSSGQLINVNNGPNNTPAGGPQTATGVNANCAAMPGSTVTGVKLVGQLGFFDSTLGDLLSLNTFTCQ
ncbi:MAG: hypothetical protein SF182_16585, partial [Deltaproteobacteria bacterium]|nr:hypothetical protein [Deltaproteobacteria bacterium]